MKKAIGLLLWLTAVSVQAAESAPAAAPNGVTLPAYFKEWRIIGVSQRNDKQSLRAILGNPAAVEAARQGRTQPWPDGAILAKIAWKDAALPEWPAAIVPGELQHVEFMVKDAGKYVATGGWGFARWLGNALVPYGKDAAFDQECFQCHGAVKARDYVFTRPVVIP
ncbi:MAG: cytochrome P460 [Methylococcaceae bacterium]|nr:MAG: cytochrome P460 [Methylococcaceae bacterium]